MTDKELHRLHRKDLLQLLLAQSRETDSLRQQVKELQMELRHSESNNEHLKARLDAKDHKMEKLKARLDRKDSQIRELHDIVEKQRNTKYIHADKVGSLAVAALRLNGIFADAQKAAEQYIYNLRVRCGKEDSDEDPELENTLRRLEAEIAADAAELEDTEETV